MVKDFLFMEDSVIMKYRALKIICLNLAIALLNIIMFSKGLVGLSFTGSALSAAFAVTTVVMSLIAFGYGNYTLLFSEKKEPKIQLLRNGDMRTTDDYTQALQSKKEYHVFDEEINIACEQIARMKDKETALSSILDQFFVPEEITYTRFRNAITSVQAIFYNNCKKMVNRMIIFDYKDYKKLSEKARLHQANSGAGAVSRPADQQLAIYNEHITYVRELVSTNEAILTKLDALLLEISKLDDLDEKGLENIAAIQEINDLIVQTKYYKS